MNMDWSNERYVRIYTRDTKTWKLIGWEGQTVLCLISRRFDRAGVLDDVHNGEDVALMIGSGFPPDVAERGLSKLIDREVMEFTDAGLFWPNFMEAQEASMSDAHRKRESRSRRRDQVIRSQNVTDIGDSVTKRDNMSHAVTGCHNLSQPVTPSLPFPSVPSVPSVPSKKKSRKPASSAQKKQTNSEISELTRKYLYIFNAVFERRCGARLIVEKKIKTRIDDGIAPWQILCSPVLQHAMDPDAGKIRNFGPEMLLRDGNHGRRGESGATYGATDWIERIYMVADRQRLDERLTAIAAHFELTDHILRTGATIVEMKGENA